MEEKFEKVWWANQGESCGKRWEIHEIRISKIEPKAAKQEIAWPVLMVGGSVEIVRDQILDMK